MVGNFSTSKKSGVDGAGVDGDLRLALGDVLVVHLDGPGGLAELTADVGHHQVLHHERALGVIGIDLPGGRRGGQGNEGDEGNERTHQVSP
jgi:hypothetical protein